MNAVGAVRDYVHKIVADVPGMKVLLMDHETTSIVAMAMSQTEILAKEVFLVQRLDVAAAPSAENMSHLKAVCLLRPTRENIDALKSELKKPRYGEYHIFFTNLLRQSWVEELAESDEHESVRQVQEYFADFLAIGPDLVSIAIPSVVCLNLPSWDQRVFDRMSDGLLAVLLALKRRPEIRYEASSELCRRLAEETSLRMSNEAELFGFRRPDAAPLLLVLDRREDPVTPLLTQWTYQAMIHDLIGMENNRIDMRSVPGVRKDQEEIVLSLQDDFYAKNVNSNFGDLGVAVKELVDEFQTASQSNQNISSIEDMQRFMDNYPEFRKKSGNVSKHVLLMHEMSRRIENGNLMEVSEIEQALACSCDHSTILRAIQELIRSPKLTEESRLRLVMLYALRYETNAKNETHRLIELLAQTGMAPSKLGLIGCLTKYAGQSFRKADLYGNRTMLASLKKSIKGGLKGVQNVLTQHQPLLSQTLDAIVKGKLRTASHPYIGNANATGRDVPSDIIVFMVGGATYEEARVVANLNAGLDWEGNPIARTKTAAVAMPRIILAGTTVHSARSFIADLDHVRAPRR